MTDAEAAEADLRRLRPICRSWPEVEESTLQARPLFRVRRRRFAIYNDDFAPSRPRWDGWGRSIHFLTDPFEREALHDGARFSPSPHHGDRGWFGLRLDDGEPDWTEIAELVEAGYRQAAPTTLVHQLDGQSEPFGPEA